MDENVEAEVEQRAAKYKAQFEEMLAQPVPEPSLAQLDAMSLFRYGVPYSELPDE